MDHRIGGCVWWLRRRHHGSPPRSRRRWLLEQTACQFFAQAVVAGKKPRHCCRYPLANIKLMLPQDPWRRSKRTTDHVLANRCEERPALHHQLSARPAHGCAPRRFARRGSACPRRRDMSHHRLYAPALGPQQTGSNREFACDLTARGSMIGKAPSRLAAGAVPLGHSDVRSDTRMS